VGEILGRGHDQCRRGEIPRIEVEIRRSVFTSRDSSASRAFVAILISANRWVDQGAKLRSRARGGAHARRIIVRPGKGARKLRSSMAESRGQPLLGRAKCSSRAAIMPQMSFTGRKGRISAMASHHKAIPALFNASGPMNARRSKLILARRSL